MKLVKARDKIKATGRDELHVSGNDKTGISFDLQAIAACPGKTEACQMKRILANGKQAKNVKCYAMQGLMFMAQKYYANNFRLLKKWFSSKVSLKTIAERIFQAIVKSKGFKKCPWIRFHASGDIFAPWYAEVIYLVAVKLKEVNKGVYLYTRSHVIPTMLPAILKLSKVADVNLSADYTNFEATAAVFTSSNTFRRVACMHDNDNSWMFALVNDWGIRKSQIIGFPEHSGGLETPRLGGLPSCPAIMGVLKSDSAGAACQKCKAICHA